MQQDIGGRFRRNDADVTPAVLIKSEYVRYLDGSPPGFSDRALVLYSNGPVILGQISQFPASNRDSCTPSRLANDLKITY